MTEFLVSQLQEGAAISMRCFSWRAARRTHILRFSAAVGAQVLPLRVSTFILLNEGRE